MRIVSSGILMIAGACVALGLIHLRFWLAERKRRDYLAFSIVCLATAGYSLFEFSLMNAGTPDEYNFLTRWAHLPAAVVLLAVAWFTYVNLGGRRWLLWTIISLRTATLILNFTFTPNIHFRQITSIGRVTLFSEQLSYPVAVHNEWMIVAHLSFFVIIIFCLDASVQTWRKGRRRKALVFGTSIFLFTAFSGAVAIGVLWGLVELPMLASVAIVFLILGMLYELNHDMHRMARLSRELIEREAELRETLEYRKFAEEAVHDLSRKLINAQERERARLARELHDDLSQSLALLSIRLGELRQKSSDPTFVKSQVDDLTLEIERLSADVHRISHELHPAKLTQLGLESAMRGFCREVAAGQPIEVNFHAENVPRMIPDDVSLSLYRITQESMQNVVKHSGADTVVVHIKLEDGEIRLTVKDDGCGFDPERAKTKESLGLVSIRERIHAIKGTVQIDSSVGSGTRIEVRVPVSWEVQ